MGRWGRRDPILPLTNEAYKYASCDPVRSRDASGLITVTTDQVLPKFCGAYSVRWTFRLDAPAPCDGWMIQHIAASSISQDLMTGVQTPGPSSDYWEAWFIRRGALVDADYALFGYTDGSSRPSLGYGTLGNGAAFGTIRFFCAHSIGMPNQDWPRQDWDPGSGDLPSTRTEPWWWNVSLEVEGESQATRFVQHRWSCPFNPDMRENRTELRVFPPAPGFLQPPASFTIPMIPVGPPAPPPPRSAPLP